MFIGVEIGFMVRYTIENDKYEGNRINYSSCESPKLTSTTLNTNVITWDKLATKTRHTTSRDTIPGTTSTTRVDTTQTYKCEIIVITSTTVVNKDEYMSFYIARTSASYTPPNYNAADGYANRRYTDSYTIVVSDNLPNGKVSVTVQNGYKNQSTWSGSKSWSYSTTALGYSYTSTSYIQRIWFPQASTFLEIPHFTGGYVPYRYNTTLSNSSSSSAKETETVHNIGTSSVSMPMYVTQTKTLAFTTVNGGLPRMNIIVNNSVINSAYLSYNNYNAESSLFYLGTVNVNITTKITSERVV